MYTTPLSYVLWIDLSQSTSLSKDIALPLYSTTIEPALSLSPRLLYVFRGCAVLSLALNSWVYFYEGVCLCLAAPSALGLLPTSCPHHACMYGATYIFLLPVYAYVIRMMKQFQQQQAAEEAREEVFTG